METNRLETIKNILFKLEKVESNDDLLNVENAIDSCLIVQNLKKSATVQKAN
ncbi:hypothetical protein [Clostridium thermobutyricum]|uniref:hypothetical protein n=1 Tax=Clostridium thermobutyricum TaxID=29372 RepID=UPI0018A90512|nr:hypothetical protein [Clostridium thermobutyricum]